MHNDKYIVLKADDFAQLTERYQDDAPTVLGDISELALKDAVVIRQQDQFAPAALFSYAHACQNGVEVAMEVGLARLPSQTPALVHLAQLRDFMFEMATESSRMARKLPD